MRVLLIANTLPHTDISGVGAQVVHLAAGLRSLGHEVEILGRGRGGARGPKVLFPVAVVPAFLRVLRAFRPEVVQVHESDGAIVALITRTLQATLQPVPELVALLQVSYLEEMRSVRPLRFDGEILGEPGARERLFRWCKAPGQVLLGCLTAWLANRVLAPSRRTAAEIERDYLVSLVEVLPNVAREGEAGGSREPHLPEAGYLLFVGRLRIRKGLEVLLHAMARLRGAAPDLRLIVAGDGEHRSRLERSVRRLGLSDEVDFLGRCRADRVQALMSRATALVVPSIYEGMPLVIMEALEAGLPVVASAVSGIPEVIEQGRTGWLVPPEDVDALAAALLEVLVDPEEARRRGLAGRRWLRASATPTAVAREWLELGGYGAQSGDGRREPR